MLFNSLVFFGFTTIVLLVYPRLRLRRQNIFLLIASYIFYGYWDWRFTFLLLTSTLVDYWVGKLLSINAAAKRRRSLLILSLLVNLGILGFFKYFNFFIGSAAYFLSSMGFNPNIPVLRVILPVGISFYTFQSLSYTIDIYKRKLEPTDNFVDFALFVSFFPQLVAGPIERARNLLPQISNARTVTRADMWIGINLVLLGYFKKIVIADTLAPIVDAVFSNPQVHSSGQLLSGILGFSFQIYADFAGYSDIARGVSRMMGFRIMENFNAPYLSRSIKEFWRRWHISLSSWLRDYLYIPLGGNRKGKARTYLNLIVTMLLGGLWHGAAWHFVLWGFLHGVLLSVHRVLHRGQELTTSWPTTLLGWIRDGTRIIGTFILVSIAWVFFRSPDITSAITYLRGMLRFEKILDVSPVVLFATLLVVVLDIVQTATGSHTWIADCIRPAILRYGLSQLLLIGILAASVAHLGTLTPFIYFQF